MSYMNVEIEYKNEQNEFDYVTVALEGEFDYDFEPEGRKFTICENIHWDKSDYTEIENKAIDAYIKANFDELSDDLCKIYNS